MPQKEKLYWAMAQAVLLATIFYVYKVWSASVIEGAVAAPRLWMFIGYLAFIIAIGWIFFVSSKRSSGDHGDNELAMFDERDRMVSTLSHARASHVASGLGYLALGAFFFHRDGNLLFHTVFVGLMVTEFAMCALHIKNYNRPI